jgi:predicted ABC-type ATPase
VGAADVRANTVDRLRTSDAGAGHGLDELAKLPAGHPSSPRYSGGSRAADQFRPLTDAEHAEHVIEVKARLANAREAGLATQFWHTIDPGREVWSAQRRALHDQIISDCHAAARDVPCQRRAIVAGGLPGAGKTTVLADYAGIDICEYLVINPDGIKAELASRQLIPGIDGLTPMEAAELVHEESSHIAKRLARLAQAEGRNVIWDITMSKAESASRRIESLRQGGYAEVAGLFIDSPVDVSVKRADARYRDGHDAYRAGTGLGGRFVAEDVIRAQTDPAWGSRNRANFEALKRRFDFWSVYDNSGPAPALVADGSHARDDRPTLEATRRTRQ